MRYAVPIRRCVPVMPRRVEPEAAPARVMPEGVPARVLARVSVAELAQAPRLSCAAPAGWWDAGNVRTGSPLILVVGRRRRS